MKATAQHSPSSRLTAAILSLPSLLLLLLCCVLPLGWLVIVCLATPEVRANLLPSAFRLELLARTLFYNGLVALLAVLLALPAALALGRGRPWLRKLLWVLLPAGLLMPSLAYAYGWAQLVRLFRDSFAAMGIEFSPASAADVARCIWTLAAWLWPIPAVILGLSLRRMDSALQLQAVSEGALWRVTLRQLASPALTSFAVVMLLATQEFSVYEPTGISVVATEIRMVFETGTFSGLANPMTAPMGGAGGTGLSPDQAQRAAAAVVTALPLLLVTLLLTGLALWTSRRAEAGDAVTTAHWPKVLNAPAWASVLSILLVLLTMAVPVASLYTALRVPLSLERIWIEFGPEITGALTVAGITTAAALLLAFASTARWPRFSLALFGLTFLIGGQLLAIALIRLWNRPALSWAYDAWPVPVMAYLGRFGWLALAAAGGTWSLRWQELRDMAAIDGAGPLRTAVSILWPLAWPTLLAGCLLAGALSMTEVPATVLLQPANPRVLTPMLMSWVHMARYDPMIEASLLMMAGMLLPWAAAILLYTWTTRRSAG